MPRSYDEQREHNADAKQPDMMESKFYRFTASGAVEAETRTDAIQKIARRMRSANLLDVDVDRSDRSSPSQE